MEDLINGGASRREAGAAGFGSRNLDFFKLLEPGSQIWVVTRISKEFSLAGRVKVQEVVDRNCIPQEDWPEGLTYLLQQWRFVAIADAKHSAFFETNNAEPP